MSLIDFFHPAKLTFEYKQTLANMQKLREYCSYEAFWKNLELMRKRKRRQSLSPKGMEPVCWMKDLRNDRNFIPNGHRKH